MIVHCPACDRTHPTADSQVGQRLLCRCGQWLMVAKRRNGTHYAVKVQGPEKERER